MKKVKCPECKEPMTYIQHSVEFKCLYPKCPLVRVTYTWDFVKELRDND